LAHSQAVGPDNPGPTDQKPQERLDRVAIRFAGDSGDGVQLTGTKFTESTALAGNDLSTLPDFPAEIRAFRPSSRAPSGK
jgi:2-oxoglutarate ferredoxin oxidoreductase subunit alpha